LMVFNYLNVDGLRMPAGLQFVIWCLEFIWDLEF